MNGHTAVSVNSHTAVVTSPCHRGLRGPIGALLGTPVRQEPISGAVSVMAEQLRAHARLQAAASTRSRQALLLCGFLRLERLLLLELRALGGPDLGHFLGAPLHLLQPMHLLGLLVSRLAIDRFRRVLRHLLAFLLLVFPSFSFPSLYALLLLHLNLVCFPLCRALLRFCCLLGLLGLRGFLRVSPFRRTAPLALTWLRLILGRSSGPTCITCLSCLPLRLTRLSEHLAELLEGLLGRYRRRGQRPLAQLLQRERARLRGQSPILTVGQSSCQLSQLRRGPLERKGCLFARPFSDELLLAAHLCRLLLVLMHPLAHEQPQQLRPRVA